MKHFLIFIFVFSWCALSGQASLENIESPAFQKMSKDVPVFIEFEWLFNTNDLPECNPSENSSSLKTERNQESESVHKDVRAYPNPNSLCLLTVDFEVTAPGSNLLLSGLDGKLLYSENLGDFTGRYKKQLDLSVAPSTVVILTVVQNGIPASQKIIVD